MNENNTVSLAEFRENPDNPSKATEEEIERLAGKLKRVPLGLTAIRIAYVTDKGGKMVISGNKRLRVLKRLYGENGTIPAEWVQDVTAMSESERHEFIVSANVSDGEWDIDKLLTQYGQNELNDLMGAENVAELLEGLEPEQPKEKGETDEDEIPDAPERPKSVRGKVYQLGQHRLMCGDSTNKEDVAKLMNGELADLVVIDPPYNVNYQGTAGSIENDNMDDESFHKFLVDAFSAIDSVLKDGASFYIWHADSEGFNFRGACRDVGWKVRQCLIWVKNSLCLGRQDYQWRHEPCLYGWKKGTHNWYNDRKQTTCIEMDKPTKSAEHPTMKPVALFEYEIGNSSKENDIVLDVFGGSGTTALACENLNRKARLVELDERYCDVIRRRWAEYVYGEGCDWEEMTKEVEA